MVKPNYAFAKRQRDLAKQQRKQEKQKRKAATETGTVADPSAERTTAPNESADGSSERS